MHIATATCPFCGLLCDDLKVAADGLTLAPKEGACDRARAEFESLGTARATEASSRVDGRAADADTALDAAARLLSRARRPLVGGLAADVAGMRATLALARRIGAIVDHAGAPAKYRNLHVLQESGWITTTFAEVRNRADVVLAIGAAWRDCYPRFVERLLAPGDTLFGDLSHRRVILLDERAARAARSLPEGFDTLALGTPFAELPATLALLNARIDDRPVDAASIPGGGGGPFARAAFARAVEWLRGARYAVVVWAAAEFEFAHAELALQSLADLIRALNRSGRCAGLPLAGTDGDLTANAVQTWQSGVPYPASYANGTIDFDPHRYAGAAVLGRGEADCLLWIASLSRETVPPATDLPMIMLGRADLAATALAREPAVFIPVATPGVDAAGQLLRSDKVVSLPLPRLRESGLPSVATVMTALAARLAEPAC